MPENPPPSTQRASGRQRIWLALVFVLVLYWLLSGAMLVLGMAKTDGQLIYPLDDTYIHMAIGRHFVEEGHWSVSAGESFTSTTSSPLWTLLIAISYAVFGVNDWSPMLLNLIFGSAALLLTAFLLRKEARLVTLTIYLVMIMLFVPLPAITLSGMEHILHAWLSLWLFFYGARMVSAAEKPTWRQSAGLMLLSALVCSTRYEGLFLVATLGIFLVSKRRWLQAVLIGAAGFLPLAVYGLVSVANGWGFLPASLMVKGNNLVLSPAGLIEFFSHMPSSLMAAPHMLALLIASMLVLLLLEERKVTARLEKTLLAVFITNSLIHLLFANVGWFFRYESYLMLSGCTALVLALRPLIYQPTPTSKAFLRYSLVGIGLAGLLILPAGWRALKAINEYAAASENIYQQHYQMGRFVSTYYDGQSIAANDIGAINYLADLKLLDLLGLGSIEVARARQSGDFDRAALIRVVQDHAPQIAIVYDDILNYDPPDSWQYAGSWHIEKTVVVGNNTVSFYACNAQEYADLMANLRAFSPQLPQNIRQSGPYLESP